MAEEAGNADRPTDLALRCGHCCAAMRARGKVEGLKCPHCHSADLQPIPMIGGAIDYACADRRHGTTSADVMLAEWAKWCGYVTPNQYNTAMHRQNSELQSSGAARPIHEVMIGLESIDEERVAGLLQFLSRKHPDADDDDFLARLAKREDVNADEVAEVAALQRSMAAKRHEVPPIGQLLVQRRVLTEAQLLEVLKAQAADGRGALHMALAMSQPVPKDTASARLARTAQGAPQHLRTVAVVALLALLVAGAWAWRLHKTPYFVIGRCERCEHIVKVEWSPTRWPAVCPRCKRVGVRYALICPKGHVFTRAFPFTNEKCPECGAPSGRPLTDEDCARLEKE